MPPPSPSPEAHRLAAPVVRAYDPVAMEVAAPLMPEVEMCCDPYAMAEGCDALMVVTEWNEFKQLDLERVRDLMRQPVIFDGRNIYDPAVMKPSASTTTAWAAATTASKPSKAPLRIRQSLALIPTRPPNFSSPCRGDAPVPPCFPSRPLRLCGESLLAL